MIGPVHRYAVRAEWFLRKPEGMRRVVEHVRAFHRSRGKPAPELWSMYLGIADLLEGDDDQALPTCKRALEVHERRSNGHISWTASLCVGWALLGRGEPARAIPFLERAVGVTTPARVAYFDPLVRFPLARALWDSKKDRKRAVELAKQTLADYEKLRANGCRYMLRDLDEVKSWLHERGAE